MKILIINPPHRAIGSRMANEHLPPLGLLSIGGPLIDAGNEVKLLDADYAPMSIKEIVYECILFHPDIIMLGHSGSTSAQPVINELCACIKASLNDCVTIVGGVFPTYHWKQILEENLAIDYIVCGEGERVIINLTHAISEGIDPSSIRGIAMRKDHEVIKNLPEILIRDLEEFRIGWELMGSYNYTYWGKKKAVVIQFSRGCPYPCNYCGQSLFWKKWRHRDPQKLADEIEMLHYKYGIEVINFADENPSTVQKPWQAFLEALIAKNLKLILVGSIRADNICRDAEILPLYKKAGFERFLLGIENYDEQVLEKIKKAGTSTKDREAIALLRKNNILSMATYVVGFGEESTRDFIKSLKQLLSYDPDQVQLLYVTPHMWTPYFNDVAEQEIIQLDQGVWDYKHQILSTTKLKPWMVIIYVKIIEIIMQSRPKALYRLFFHPDKRLRKAMMWYTKIGRRVWFHELYQFFFKETHVKNGIKLKEFWKALS
jgi:anaerobic magnesium-protoporphyrin IX monomethyl ester cyclase